MRKGRREQAKSKESTTYLSSLVITTPIDHHLSRRQPSIITKSKILKRKKFSARRATLRIILTILFSLHKVVLNIIIFVALSHTAEIIMMSGRPFRSILAGMFETPVRRLLRTPHTGDRIVSRRAGILECIVDLRNNAQGISYKATCRPYEAVHLTFINLFWISCNVKTLLLSIEADMVRWMCGSF